MAKGRIRLEDRLRPAAELKGIRRMKENAIVGRYAKRSACASMPKLPNSPRVGKSESRNQDAEKMIAVGS